MAGLVDYIPPFLPTKPRANLNYYSFPNDLVSDGRQFCMDIQFMDYDPSLTTVGLFATSLAPYFPSAAYKPSGGITLPIPKKLNDVQTVVWQSVDAISSAASVTNVLQNISRISALASIAGGLVHGGLTLNPHLFMLFKSPAFKEYSLSWTFAPKNEQESYTIARMIQQIKTAMLPNTNGFFGSVLLGYPKIAIIKLYPDDFFTFKLKPCAILSVNVDYTGTGQPSFFKKTGAPTAIHLSIALKEIQYNTSNNLNA